jgi:hypothetical protein
MNLKVGDLLVFVGNKNLQSKHYDENFEVGKSYRISRIEKIAYDLDDSVGYNNECIIFENHTHGSYLDSVLNYFVTIEDYRNSKIEKIIN